MPAPLPEVSPMPPRAAGAWPWVGSGLALLRDPTSSDHLAGARHGDDRLLEQCANESIRMAQRSLTLRYVMSPLDFDDGARSYRLAPGVMIATMLPVTNTSAAPGLERFDPAHYDGRRLAEHIELPARELVSTFGHGRHSCPAQRFSISAIRIAIRRLVHFRRRTRRPTKKVADSFCEVFLRVLGALPFVSFAVKRSFRSRCFVAGRRRSLYCPRKRRRGERL